MGRLWGASILHPPLGTYRCRLGSSPGEGGAGKESLPTFARAHVPEQGREDGVIAALRLTAPPGLGDKLPTWPVLSGRCRCLINLGRGGRRGGRRGMLIDGILLLECPSQALLSNQKIVTLTLQPFMELLLYTRAVLSRLI